MHADLDFHEFMIYFSEIKSVFFFSFSEKGGGRMKSIATFFSKRCLPPAGRNINPNETSPQPSLKPSFTDQ